jgi:hypothetical protein
LKRVTGESPEYAAAAPALAVAIGANNHSLRRAFVGLGQPYAVVAAVCRCPNLRFLHVDVSYPAIRGMLNHGVFPECESVSILDWGTFHEVHMLPVTREVCLEFWTRLVLSPRIRRLALHGLGFIAPDVDNAIYAPDMNRIDGRAVWIHRPCLSVRRFRALYNGVRELHLCFVAGENLLSVRDLRLQTNHIVPMLEAIAGVYAPPRTVTVDVFCPGSADAAETPGTLRLMAALCAVYPPSRGFVFTLYVRSDVADTHPLPPSIVVKPYSRTALNRWGWDPDGINYNRYC